MHSRLSKQRKLLVPALAAIAAVALIIAAACHGPNDNSPTSPSVTYNIVPIAGNGAKAPIGTPITIGAGVTNQIGVWQTGVRVDFKVLDGTGTLGSAYVVTDTAGRAYNTITPTYAPGDIQIQAQVYLTTSKTVITCTGE